MGCFMLMNTSDYVPILKSLESEWFLGHKYGNKATAVQPQLDIILKTEARKSERVMGPSLLVQI